MIWLSAFALWLMIVLLMIRHNNQQTVKSAQLNKYLKSKPKLDKSRSSWFAFYTRLETLVGKEKLSSYRVYFMLGIVVTCGLLISQGMAPVVVVALLLTGSGVFLYLAIKHFEAQAIAEFNAQMPDIIDSMERAVKVGAPLQDIFLTLSEQYHGSAKRLFLTMHDRLKLGHSVERVMKFAYEQMPSQEFQFLTILLSLQNETGGKLSHMLSQLGQTLRERSLMDSRVKTITSEARTSAKVLAALPIVLIAVLYSSAREHFDYLLSHDSGQWVLVYVVASIVTGLLIIRQLSKVKG